MISANFLIEYLPIFASLSPIDKYIVTNKKILFKFATLSIRFENGRA